MARPTRPSDVYDLTPAPAPPAPATSSADPEPPPPRRRLPAALAGAGLVAALVVLVAVAPDGAPAPVVDVVNEEQAVAALHVYDVQRRTGEELARRADVLANPGPTAAARAAGQRLAEAQKALGAARAARAADPLVARYWSDPAHDRWLTALEALVRRAQELALLSATHDTLYGGAGAIDPQQAQQQLTSMFSVTPETDPARRWAQLLLAEMDGVAHAGEAAAAREAAGQRWAEEAAALQPPAVEHLVAYVQALPAQTRRDLAGHPIAGSALTGLGLR